MNLKHHLHLILAIAFKDLQDAIKNKTVLAVLLGVVMVMLSSQAMGFLVQLKSEPTAFYYDQGKSTLIKEITRGRQLAFYPESSLGDVQTVVGLAAEPVLGILIPADFDALVQAGGVATLQAYSAHWLPSTDLAACVAYFEQQLSERTGITVRLHIAGNTVYPSSDGDGYPMMIAFGLVMGVMTIGMFLTPYLILDERDSHTLDALLMSPARTVHLVIGKALVGLSYSLVASLGIFLFSWRWFVHWDVVALAIILGGLCAVALGLLGGVLFESVQSVNAFLALMVAGLMLPIPLWGHLSEKLPMPVQSLVNNLPSLAMYRLARLTFTESVALPAMWRDVAILLAWMGIILVLVGWKIRLMDR